jgi:hypothetical protein
MQNMTVRESHTLRTWAGAGPNAGPEPKDQRYPSVIRAWVHARTALCRQEVTSKDLGLRLCLEWSCGLISMCYDSDDSE